MPGWVALAVVPRVLRHGEAYLRGTPLDLFGRQAERVWERALISQYEADLNAAMEAHAAPGHAGNRGVVGGTALDQDPRLRPRVLVDANRVKAEGRRKVLLESLQAPQLAVAAEDSRVSVAAWLRQNP